MATQSSLDRTLVALADPTRRAILQRLSEGEARVTELAHPFAMSLNAVSKHIRVLEAARLVRRRRVGREHLLSLDPGALDEAAAWIEAQRSLWTARLSALDAMLRAEDHEAETNPPGERTSSMSVEPRVRVRVAHRFSASPERVFDAWLDPARAGRWLFATPTGEMVRVEIDARVGGAFTFVDRRDGEEVEHTGAYLEIDRPRRLVFTFSVGGSEDADRVTVEIVALEEGCELVLTHEMDPEWAEYAGRAEQGWAGILAGLAAALGEGSATGGPGA